jgi:anti-sigma B factor antagonist
VRLIDSTALGLLVRAHQDAKRYGRFVCLVAPSRFVITVLHTMRLRAVFPDFPDLGQTREWLAALP